jgi:cytochrome c551/c552
VKWLKRILMALVLMLLLIQLVRPARTNPPVDPARTIQALTKMTSEVDAIFKRSCNDCHSYETRWPWYSNVAPVSWLVINDVKQGRRHASLSDWASYDRKRALHVLDEMNDEVGEGDMPPWKYIIVHPDAALSDADRSVLLTWAREEKKRLESLPE